LFSILQKLDTSQQEIFSVMLWSLWKQRNNKVGDNTVEKIQVVCDRASALLSSWKNAQQSHNFAPDELWCF
jgi:hypothetical protein